MQATLTVAQARKATGIPHRVIIAFLCLKVNRSFCGSAWKRDPLSGGLGCLLGGAPLCDALTAGAASRRYEYAGVHHAALPAGRGVSVRLEPRGHGDLGQADAREGRACAAVTIAPAPRKALARMSRRGGSYPRQNGLALALRELGRLERSIFMLDWLRDIDLRRRTQAGLNKGEARNALARASSSTNSASCGIGGSRTRLIGHPASICSSPPSSCGTRAISKSRWLTLAHPTRSRATSRHWAGSISR